jgi:DUF4097 and DUF4098 domain-containing protein YvlB
VAVTVQKSPVFQRLPFEEKRIMKWMLPVFVSVFLVFPAFVFAADYDFQRLYSKKMRVEKNDIISIDNPIGEIHLSNTPSELGSNVIIKQTIHSVADELAKSRQLVMLVRTEEIVKKDSVNINVLFPLKNYQKFCYPAMGGFFSSEVSGNTQGTRITVSAKKGTTLWSDIYVQVPAGQKVIVKSVASTFVIEDFVGDIDFSTDHASAMTAGAIVGNLLLTACHGTLSVSKLTGSLFYDGEDSDLSFCDLVKGKVYAKSTTGDIIWGGKTDSCSSLELQSLSGKIMFNGETAQFTKLANDEGDIEIELASNVKDSLIVSSNTGDIDIKISDTQCKTFEANTIDGKISHNFAGNNKKSLSEQLKGQTGKIILKSVGGDIDLNLK